MLRSKGKVSIAIAATTALACSALTAPAAAKDDFFVTAGKRINGIALGDTRPEVRNSTPFKLKKPTTTSRTPTIAGDLLTETYIAQSGQTLIVGYGKSKKKKNKKKPPKVLFVSTGAGIWIIRDTGGIAYNTPAGTGSTPTEVAQVFPCSFYQKSPSGQRLYDPDIGDGQYCELIQDQRTYFYFTFNHVGPGANVPAELAGLTLSRFQIP